MVVTAAFGDSTAGRPAKFRASSADRTAGHCRSSVGHRAAAVDIAAGARTAAETVAGPLIAAGTAAAPQRAADTAVAGIAAGHTAVARRRDTPTAQTNPAGGTAAVPTAPRWPLLAAPAGRRPAAAPGRSAPPWCCFALPPFPRPTPPRPFPPP